MTYSSRVLQREVSLHSVFSWETLTETDKHPERSLCCTQFPAEDGLPWESVTPLYEHKTVLSRNNMNVYDFFFPHQCLTVCVKEK